jgi:hypothetical protein
MAKLSPKQPEFRPRKNIETEFQNAMVRNSRVAYSDGGRENWNCAVSEGFCYGELYGHLTL